MAGRRVERIEAMVFIFDLRSVGDSEADFPKAADDVLGHLRERMELAQGAAAAWQCKIGRLAGQRGLKFEFAAALCEGRFKCNFDGIDGFAGTGLLLLRQTPKLLHQRSESAMRTEIIDASLLQSGQIRRTAQFSQSRLFQPLNFLQKVHKQVRLPCTLNYNQSPMRTRSL